jgi:hypothetical protein
MRKLRLTNHYYHGLTNRQLATPTLQAGVEDEWTSADHHKMEV